LPSYKFNDGNTLNNVTLHYVTLGTPRRDASGQITNAVLFLHGTGASSQSMLTEDFMQYMYAPGRALDANLYYVILPDSIGHGKSSRPSPLSSLVETKSVVATATSSSSSFPHYNYDDAVRLQHLLVTQGLQMQRLHLVMGISMGGMHTWLWSIMFPKFMTGAMPIVCEPDKIKGRNLLWRRMLIRGDADGALFGMMLDGVFDLEHKLIDVQSCDDFIDRANKQFAVTEQTKYALDSSRDYDPAPHLGQIVTRVFALNFSDDELNVADLHTLPKAIADVKRGSYVIQCNQTYGHSTAFYPQFWALHLKKFLQKLSPDSSRTKRTATRTRA